MAIIQPKSESAIDMKRQRFLMLAKLERGEGGVCGGRGNILCVNKIIRVKH